MFPILIKRGMADKLEENELLKVWPKAVGNQICKQTKVSAFKNGTLFVKTTSSIWGQQLHFIKEEILKKINKITGKHLVKEIRFSVGHIPSSGVKVELSDSKDFLNERDIDFIDTYCSDIQGNDLTVLKTLSPWIKSKKIGSITCETSKDMHQNIYELGDNSESGFKALLNENYFLAAKGWGILQDGEFLDVDKDWWEMDCKWRLRE